MLEFPIEMFLAGSDLTPIKENIDKIVYGLTKWEPEIKEKGVYAPAKVTVEGKDYQEAVANMNLLFLQNMWSDGLPLLPATEDRIEWLLRGTDLPPDTVIGKILPRGGIASVETIAVNLAMAGGRPEYLPVLIAAVEAVVDPLAEHQQWNATTCSTIPTVIVNGPIAKQIRLNSGYGCLGPSSTYPAGGTIGRALRLILQNMGGAIPGIGTMAIYGAGRHTGLVFAEDEDGSPWEPLSVERGFPQGSNVVTFFIVASAVNTEGGIRGPRGVKQSLLQNAAIMGSPAKNQRYSDATPGIGLWARGTAQAAADLGWSKLDAKKFMWENSKVPWSDIDKALEATAIEKTLEANPSLAKGEPWPLTTEPESIMIVIAGGAQSGHSYWMQRGTRPNAPVSKEIKLPANWDELIKESEEDLGPIPAG